MVISAETMRCSAIPVGFTQHQGVPTWCITEPHGVPTGTPTGTYVIPVGISPPRGGERGA